MNFIEVNPNIVHTHKINYSKAFKYAKLMEQGNIFPPIKAYKDNNGKIICKNGAHRVHACKMLNKLIKIRLNEKTISTI